MSYLNSDVVDSSDLTPQFVGDCLKQQGIEMQVSAINLTPMNNQGRQSHLQHLEVQSEDGESIWLVCKEIGEVSLMNQGAIEDGAFERECHMYRLGSDFAGINMVRCYHSGYKADEPKMLLILEDLSPKFAGSSEKTRNSYSYAEMVKVVEALAQLHGKHWNDPHLNELDWLYDAKTLNDKGPVLKDPHFIPGVLERLSPIYSEYHQELNNLLLERLYDLAAISFESFALVHGDAHKRNVKIDDAGNVWFIDWNYAGCGNPGIDLAKLLFNVEQDAPGNVPKVMAHYLQRLQSQGIDLDWDELCKMISLGIVRELLTRLFVANEMTFDEGQMAAIRRNYDIHAETFARMNVLDSLKSQLS